jgi:hypothetical protein
MGPEEATYCIGCGVRLEPAHRYCWNCGTARWAPDQAPAPPMVVEARGSALHPTLGLLPWFYAAGAVFFLIWATRALAVFLSPSGRETMAATMTAQGIAPSMQAGLLVAYGVLLVGAALLAAALHGAAFYGLRRQRRWGWLSAVVVAGLWSLLVVGIPVLLRLVDRSVRRGFGVD